MRTLALLAALLFALPAAAKTPGSSAGGAQKEFSHSKDCPGFSLPNEVRPFVIEATEAEAAASGMRKHIKPTGEGGICAGKIYKVTGALHVYRALIAIGSGQSVDCAKLNAGRETFPATGIVQIAVDARKDITAADCTPPAKGSKW